MQLQDAWNVILTGATFYREIITTLLIILRQTQQFPLSLHLALFISNQCVFGRSHKHVLFFIVYLNLIVHPKIIGSISIETPFLLCPEWKIGAMIATGFENAVCSIESCGTNCRTKSPIPIQCLWIWVILYHLKGVREEHVSNREWHTGTGDRRQRNHIQRTSLICHQVPNTSGPIC